MSWWFGGGKRRPRVVQFKRRLVMEPLESRQVLNAAWSGTLIHDSTGDLFTVDVFGTMAVQYVGTTSVVMYDMAFSPSGQLYGVGGSSSGPSRLYQIDVDFSGPSPSVETRLVGTVTMGGLGIYVNSLEFSPDGELFAAGYDAFGNNALFKIDEDTAGAQREFHLDAYESAGDMEFDEFGNLYLTTMGGDLLNLDVRNDSYQRVGSLWFGDFYGVTYGAAPLFYGFRQNREVYRINPNTAEITPIALLSHPQLDWVYGSATVFAAPTNLGRVDFADLADQTTVLGERWYRVETVRDALFSVDLPGVSNVDIELYRRNTDGSLRRLEAEEVRLDYSAAANAEYFVRIKDAPAQLNVRMANLFQLAGNGAIVYGTDGDDVFQLVAGPPYVATINGIAYRYNFNSSSLVTISFDGGVGRDQAHLTGSTRADTASLNLSTASGTLNSSAYRIDVAGTPVMSFRGGGGIDTAALTGSNGNDTIHVQPSSAQVTAGLASLDVSQVRTLTVDAAGGDDSVTFTGSAVDETVTLRQREGQFQSGAFTATVTNAESLAADGAAGNDTLLLFGGPGDDVLEAQPSQLTFTGPALNLQATNFETVQATGNLAENDSARLYGKGGALETLITSPGEATLVGGGLSRQVTGFRSVDAYGNSYEDDVAELFGDPAASDTFVSVSYYGMLSGPAYYTRAAGFRQVTARGSANDVAKFYDSATADTFRASPLSARMIYGNAADYFREAAGFGLTFAYATTANGGIDVAELSDNPGVRDTFYGRDTSATIFASGYRHWLVQFEQVTATSSGVGDDDVAYLFDSDGNDTFTFVSDPASPLGPSRLAGTTSSGHSFDNRAVGFARTYGYAFNGGNDTAYLYDSSSGAERFFGTPTYSLMTGTNIYGRAVQFEQVYAYADPNDGFDDDARLYDSAGDDVYEGRSTYARMAYNGAMNHFVRAGGFRYVTAYSTAGGNDQAILYGMAAAADKLWASLGAQYALRYNSSYYHRVNRFETLVAFGDPGEADTAYIFDSPGDDQLRADGATNPWKATVASVDQVIETWDFSYVRAHSSAGGSDTRDVKNRALLAFLLDDTGAWVDL